MLFLEDEPQLEKINSKVAVRMQLRFDDFLFFFQVQFIGNKMIFKQTIWFNYF